MPCLLALLAIAFPRIAIVLLWLFTNFFAGVYHEVIIPVLGFLFLPLTLIAYTYIQKTYTGPLGTNQIIILIIALIIDLGLVGGGTYRRRVR